MDHPPSFDRSLLIPFGVGLFSLVGICFILVVGRIQAARGTVEEGPTETPFQYVFIGTEPAILTVTMDGQGEQPTPTQVPATPVIPDTPVLQATNTAAPIITLPPPVNTNTPTPTSASTAPFGPGTYDDTDSRFVYIGDWDPRSGVTGAYLNTLHVSEALGSSVTFRFIGDELRVFFQAGSSLGTIRLTLDNASYDINQSAFGTQTYEWVLAAPNAGTHTVTITHLSGGSVNLDSIIVPVVLATPTNTPTPTSTPNSN